LVYSNLKIFDIGILFQPITNLNSIRTKNSLIANISIPSNADNLPAWLNGGYARRNFPAILIIPTLNWEADYYRE
jgi:hypothetical protein